MMNSAVFEACVNKIKKTQNGRDFLDEMQREAVFYFEYKLAELNIKPLPRFLLPKTKRKQDPQNSFQYKIRSYLLQIEEFILSRTFQIPTHGFCVSCNGITTFCYTELDNSKMPICRKCFDADRVMLVLDGISPILLPIQGK